MVHGKLKHPQSHGSVERANADIKDKLVAWMSDINMQDWTVGLKFAQQQKNCAYHAVRQKSPTKPGIHEITRAFSEFVTDITPVRL